MFVSYILFHLAFSFCTSILYESHTVPLSFGFSVRSCLVYLYLSLFSFFALRVFLCLSDLSLAFIFSPFNVERYMLC